MEAWITFQRASSAQPLILAEQSLPGRSHGQIKTNQACSLRLKFYSIKSAATQLKAGEGGRVGGCTGMWRVASHHQGCVLRVNQHCNLLLFFFFFCCFPGSPSQHPCSWMTPFASGLGSGSSCHLLESKVKVCWEPLNIKHAIISLSFKTGLYLLEVLHWGC